MKIKAIRCNNCGDIIYSRALHDYRCCSCEKTAVDGGFDYQKVNYKTSFDAVEIEVPNVTKKDLLEDYLKGKNKYGKIKMNINVFINKYNKLEKIKELK